MYLWLDDNRPAPAGWVWAKNYDKAVHHLTSMMTAPTHRALWDHHGMSDFWTISHMSFDHDLGFDDDGRKIDDDAGTGYDVALWMAEHDVWPTVGCRVHSFNPVGARAICAVVDRYGPYSSRCSWVPNGT